MIYVSIIGPVATAPERYMYHNSVAIHAGQADRYIIYNPVLKTFL